MADRSSEGPTGNRTALTPALPSPDTSPSRPIRSARRLAWAALIVGLRYVAVSVYWGLGGLWLLDTVGGSLEKQRQAGDAGLIVAVWAAVVAKAIAALLPMIAPRRGSESSRARAARALAWAEGAILTVYGLVLTAIGLLVQAGIIHAGATADHRALAWHAYLWDPWFLLWGLLVVAALLRSRGRPV